MIKYRLYKIVLILVIFIITFVSCSSGPENTGDLVDLRVMAERELTIGNNEAGRGNFDNALAILRECKRKGILVDDVSLMIRSGLSLGNILFILGHTEEAFAEWEYSVMLAQRHNFSDLLSLSRIYLLRGMLLSGSSPASSVLDDVEREAGNLRGDPLHIAFSWQVRGLALRELRRYGEAEDAIRRSLDIHERARAHENAAYDWYIIASIRSLSDNTADALQALENAMVLDRRVENSWGLASNWRAIGDVYQKAGDVNEALAAYARSRAIFDAMGNRSEIAEVDRRIGLIRGNFNE